jgi:inosine/xanthosine triphosphate pyrophosphatase family protein
MINQEIHRNTVIKQSFAYGSFKSEVESIIEYLLSKKESMSFPKDFDNEILFATSNYGKILEFKGFLDNFYYLEKLLDGIISFKVPNQKLPYIDENGSTMFENSFIKSSQSAKFLNSYVLAEDSGLCVPMLGDEPGVYSARYFHKNIHKYDSYVFSKALEVSDSLIINAKEKNENVVIDIGKRQKDRVDFLNKVMLAFEITNGIGDLDRLKIPAYFQTVATISNRQGVPVASGIGTLFGEIKFPEKFKIDDYDSLVKLHSDFGYNSIFVVSFENDNKAWLNNISIKERLKWNHRSIALTRAIVDMLIKYIVE